MSRYVWVVVWAALAIGCVAVAVTFNTRLRSSVWPSYVKRLPPPVTPPEPIVHSEGWPILDSECEGDEACLLARYRDARRHREAMEVGGLEAALGEAFAGAGPLFAAITPPGGVASVEACNRLSNVAVTVSRESLQRPQRDCYLGCLSSLSDLDDHDAVACVRDQGCAKKPVLDGEWALNRIVPRLGCLAMLAPNHAAVRPDCAQLPEMTDVPGPLRACSPRQLCATGGSAAPATMEPYILTPHHDCNLRPARWSCREIVNDFPRAACQHGAARSP